MMDLNSVDLPAPFAPTSATASFGVHRHGHVAQRLDGVVAHVQPLDAQQTLHGMAGEPLMPPLPR